MKRSMQVIATGAFLGSFAVLAIVAGSDKARSQEGCDEEWRKFESPASGSHAEDHVNQAVSQKVADRGVNPGDEWIFPAPVFYKVM